MSKEKITFNPLTQIQGVTTMLGFGWTYLVEYNSKSQLKSNYNFIFHVHIFNQLQKRKTDKKNSCECCRSYQVTTTIFSLT